MPLGGRFPLFFPLLGLQAGNCPNLLLHPVRAGLFHLGGNVSVNVQRKGGGGVAQVLLYRLDVIPGLNRHDRVCMTEVMKPGGRRSNFFHKFFEATVNDTVREEIPGFIEEHKVPLHPTLSSLEPLSVWEKIFADSVFGGEILDTFVLCTVKSECTPQKGRIMSLEGIGMAAKELPACPVETTLTLISDKWKVLILRDLLPGTKRFGELRKSVGNVSQKVLTAQLRQMEASGLLIRTVYPEVPPRVEYTLTELGYSLKPVLDAMWSWGEEYKVKRRP